MKKELEAKFYEFNQNNSGGHFDVDDNVCHRVIIEALDENHAQSIFDPMVENQSSSCSCCGDRWYGSKEIKLSYWKDKGYPIGIYSHYKDAEERWFKLYGEFPRIEEPTWQTKYGSKEFLGKIAFDDIEQYSQLMANSYGWTTPDVKIHFLDGTKKEVFTKKVP